MADPVSPQDKRREAADQYRTNTIAAGAQTRASAEMQRANQLQSGAAKLRTEAASDSAVAARAGSRLRMK